MAKRHPGASSAGVTVKAGLTRLVACENPQPPGLCGAIPQHTIVVGETSGPTGCR